MTLKKFFPVNQEVEAQISLIKKSLKLSMNGVVSDNMRDRGVKYRQNFGVSLPKLKEIASKYDQNALLADRLWHLGIRETMIMATIIHPVNELSIEKATEWIKLINTQEMLEMSAMFLFSKWDKLHAIAPEWLKSNDYRFQSIACLACARIVSTTPLEEIKVWTNAIMPHVTTSNYILSTSIGILMEKSAQAYNELHPLLLLIIERLHGNNESASVALRTKMQQTIELLGD